MLVYLKMFNDSVILSCTDYHREDINENVAHIICRTKMGKFVWDFMPSDVKDPRIQTTAFEEGRSWSNFSDKFEKEEEEMPNLIAQKRYPTNGPEINYSDCKLFFYLRKIYCYV